LEKRIRTRPFGEISIDERQVISFPEGIPGFDYIKAFALLDSGEAHSPFKWLQACDEESVAFIIMRPADFIEDYTPDIPQGDIESVGAVSLGELLVFSIVTIPEDPSKMTANLQGPVIINPVKRIGRQAISMSERYFVRHLILDEMRKSGV
jgi:flagellar assembly factor FliW